MEFGKKSKPLYDSRGDETSATVACVATAATAAAVLLEEEAILIIARKLLQSLTAAAAAGKNPLRWDYWKCKCISRNNSVDVAIINRSIDQTGNDVHGICVGI